MVDRSDMLADLVTSPYCGTKIVTGMVLTLSPLKRLREAGAEPDACFYIANWQAALGKDRIDLSATDPSPDLAIEVDITSLTDLEIYQILAIPEVWIYRQGQLSLYVLTANGYEDSTTSPTFPTVDVKNLLPEYVERAWSAGSSVALREFEQALSSL
jgi:Uma2 family endonuclease